MPKTVRFRVPVSGASSCIADVRIRGPRDLRKVATVTYDDGVGADMTVDLAVGADGALFVSDPHGARVGPGDMLTETHLRLRRGVGGVAGPDRGVHAVSLPLHPSDLGESMRHVAWTGGPLAFAVRLADAMGTEPDLPVSHEVVEDPALHGRDDAVATALSIMGQVAQASRGTQTPLPSTVPSSTHGDETSAARRWWAAWPAVSASMRDLTGCRDKLLILKAVADDCEHASLPVDPRPSLRPLRPLLPSGGAAFTATFDAASSAARDLMRGHGDAGVTAAALVRLADVPPHDFPDEDTAVVWAMTARKDLRRDAADLTGPSSVNPRLTPDV